MEKKQCSKCKEGKDLDKFCKDKHSKDGLYYRCKECNKIYRKENRKRISKYAKLYAIENKEKEKIRRKKYTDNNKDKTRKRGKIFRNSPLKFNSKSKIRKEIEIYEKKIRESEDGYLQCKCAYCGDWFTPTYSSIKTRMTSINYKNLGEGRLYCSEACKKACPTYKQQLYPKGFKPATSREVQPELRQMVLKRDNYTCKRCGKHKDDLSEEGIALHCHHLEGIHGEPLMSADMDMCITYCQPCHVKAHQTPGCGYHDMQCTDIGKE